MKTRKILMVLAIALLGMQVKAEVKISDNSPDTKVTVTAVGTSGDERSFRFISKRSKILKLPAKLVGLQAVIGKSDPKKEIGFSFKVDKPVTVYLCVNEDSKVKLKGWTKTEMTAKWHEGKKIFNDIIYTKEFPAGKVVIPAADLGKPAFCAIVEEKKK